MKKIGMIAAVEIDAVKDVYGTPVKQMKAGGFDVFQYQKDDKELYVLHSGAGQISATAGTQALISEFHVDLITNFGVVGGLREELSTVSLCVVEKVVHYEFDTSEVDHCPVGQYIGEYPTIYMPLTESLVRKAVEIAPDLKVVTCASGDKFVSTIEEKKYIAETFGADICEMECAGIVKTANRNGIPCISIKMVSDSVHGGAQEFRDSFQKTSHECLSVLDKIIEKI